jgi:hypothetical protein
MKTIGINTAVALQDAPRLGLIIRDFITVKPKNRTSGAEVTICLWGGRVPVSAFVLNPETGASEQRDFTGVGAILDIPSIPANIDLEVRQIKLKFSNISAEMLAATRLYDIKMAKIQIHRGIYSTVTNQLVDPALCRFFGYVSKAPIRTAASGGTGDITLDCVSNSNMLTRTSGKLLSDQYMTANRSGDRFCKYNDNAGGWRLWWGQDEVEVAKKPKMPKQKWFKK